MSPSTPSITQHVELSLDSISTRESNTRRHYDEQALADLADNIAKHGVLEPILVRPDAGCPGGHVIVCGHRRVKASLKAGLKTIPAIVREMTDQEALEIQISENLQRSDLHPMEEAEALRRLTTEFKFSVEQAASTVGKSKAYVYQRLHLCNLPESTKKAMWSGEILLAVGIQIARIPNAKLQAQATKEILELARREGEPCTKEQVFRFITDNFMLQLAHAPFDVKDATLLPTAGACTTCPKRTGNQTDLFPDIKNADVCTDPPCFALKRNALWKRITEKAESQGAKVMSEEETKKVFSYGHMAYNAPYIDLNTDCPTDNKRRPWRKLLEKQMPPIVYARDEKGAIYRLARKEDVQKSVDILYPPKKEKSPDGQTANPALDKEQLRWRDEQRRRKKEQELKSAVYVQGMTQLIAKIENAKMSPQLWHILANAVSSGSWHDAVHDAAKRRGLLTKGAIDNKVLKTARAGYNERQLQGLVFELLVGKFGCSNYSTGFGDDFTAACKEFRIDLKKIAATIKAAAKGKKPTMAATKKTTAK